MSSNFVSNYMPLHNVITTSKQARFGNYFLFCSSLSPSSSSSLASSYFLIFFDWIFFYCSLWRACAHTFAFWLFLSRLKWVQMKLCGRVHVCLHQYIYWHTTNAIVTHFRAYFAILFRRIQQCHFARKLIKLRIKCFRWRNKIIFRYDFSSSVSSSRFDRTYSITRNA